MNREVTKLREFGMFQSIFSKNPMKKPNCTETNDEVKSISIQKAILPFILVTFGMTLALLILVAENLRRVSSF